MRHAHSLAILIATSGPCAALAKEPVTIPLKDIWALEMPGAGDIHTMRPSPQESTETVAWETERDALVERIHRSLSGRHIPIAGGAAGSAFAVEGNGLRALRGAYSVIVDRQVPKKVLTRGDVSLVFFSFQLGSYVHIKQVTKEDDEVRIEFQFVPHKTRELTSHFSIIPLAALGPGTVRVKVLETEVAEEWRASFKSSPELRRRFVCGSGEFRVSE